MTRGLYVIFMTMMSCSNNNQEPIFHLFRSSAEYPNYSEVDLLKNSEFIEGMADGRKTLTKVNDGIEISFVLSDDEELESKIARAYLNAFDTLTADKVIKNYGGQRVTIWRSEDDSTRVTSVTFDISKTDLRLKKRCNKIYLESKFDLFHRVIKD